MHSLSMRSAWSMMSTPARAQSRIERREPVCARILLPRPCAASTAAWISPLLIDSVSSAGPTPWPPLAQIFAMSAPRPSSSRIAARNASGPLQVRIRPLLPISMYQE